MTKKKKKKAVKKKNISKKKKISSTKKKSAASKSVRNDINKSSVKKSNNVSNSKKVSSGKNDVVVNKKLNGTKINVDKKKKKFNKKVLFISFILLILGIITIIFLNNNINNRTTNDGFLEIGFDEYLELYEKEGLEFVYLYHSSCINCDIYEEKLINLEKEYDIKLKKFNYSKLSENDLEILKSSNSFLEEGIEVPTIISIMDGNEISSISGIKEYSALKNFVGLSKSEQGVNKFNKIDVDEYLSILGSKEKSIIYICDSGDGCNKFSSVLDKVSSDRNVMINFLNTENIISSKDWDNLESSNEMFDDMWFMPVIMIVKDNKVISYKMETLSEKELKNFFKKNGM